MPVSCVFAIGLVDLDLGGWTFLVPSIQMLFSKLGEENLHQKFTISSEDEA